MAEYINIPNLEDINITENKKLNIFFAEINLGSFQYTENNVSVLIDKLKRLHDAGFTKFDTTYNTGYYDAVEDIGLTFIKKNGK